MKKNFIIFFFNFLLFIFFSFLLFIYLIRYFHFRYSDSFENKLYLFSTVQRNYFIKNNFGYFFRTNEEIIPLEITVTKINIFNNKKEIYFKKNPEIAIKSSSGEIYFYAVPFLTKELIVKSKILSNNKEINITQIYYPYFEFGIYPFWLSIGPS